jgi:peptidoglycan hydrolase-like protein with peptidoglycan-binding domain
MLKKSLSIALVTLIFATGISKANAYSLEDAMADITSLKTQIVDLKSQLSAAVITTKSDTTVSTLRNPEVTPAATKATITFTSPKNITPNAKGEDVITLQNALKDAGYFTASVTGTYGAKTKMAVKAFQKANNLPATGVVGNLTKSLLTNPSNPPASSQSCATTTAASWVKVLAPNGGETYTAGQQITIKWITCSLLVNNNMTIGIKNSAGVIVAVLTQSTPNDGIQTFNIPSTLQTGQYKVYVNTVYNGITYSDQSDNTFSVTAPTLSSCNPNITTPSIKVISPNGGEVYTAGQQVIVKWTSCNVPNTLPVFISLEGNNNITTNIVDATQGVLNDGSELVTLPTQGTWQGMQFGQIYKIRVGVGPFGNLSGSTSDNSDNLFTINAAPTCTSSSQPSITVLSPNGGEVYQEGQQVTIKWKSCNVSTNENVRALISFNQGASIVVTGSGNGWTNNDGEENITIPTLGIWGNLQVQPGTFYKIYMETFFAPPNIPVGYTTDFSDNLFTINNNSSCGIGSPTITLTSPNGGEVYTAGQNIPVTWTSCNLPSNTMLELNVYGGAIAFGFFGGPNGTPNDGYELIPTTSLPPSSGYQMNIGVPFYPGQFYSSVLGAPSDTTNGSFTIQ